MKDICLNYNAVRALNHTTISFKKGNIHALVGEHGAGKSSIGLLLCGLQKPSSGTIIFKNKEY